MKSNYKNLLDLLEDLKSEICDDYCRFPRKMDPEEFDGGDNDHCKQCPLSRL